MPILCPKIPFLFFTPSLCFYNIATTDGLRGQPHLEAQYLTDLESNQALGAEGDIPLRRVSPNQRLGQVVDGLSRYLTAEEVGESFTT
ncbi:unnamed protein product [Protopolystoma xenopodis]|uniref:Uncharacterized protein n=1 Tax=Protopolystoma xenopodis TaxID=117903 RepID=A0A448X766_9PLAT|nr:unnamed protein product [Protopolystoma xenopodis]